MPCYNPLRAYRAKQRTENGKRGITFDRGSGFTDMPIDIPCNRCVGCRLEYARQWAIRCMHEAATHEENCFVTLTYDDEHLPFGGTLVKEHPQEFLKRLRYYLATYLVYDGYPITATKVRYYLAGEYGEDSFRPHYHAILFGFYPSDAKLYSEKNGYKLYTSKFLDHVWGHGSVKVGSATYESAGYCARYIMKKITSDGSEEAEQLRKERYERMDLETGEIYELEPEFCTMSRRPGLGAAWIEKYLDDTYKDDTVVVGAKECLPPRYYDSFLPEETLERLKARRRRRAEEHASENTLGRLRVREEVKRAQISSLKRS